MIRRARVLVAGALLAALIPMSGASHAAGPLAPEATVSSMRYASGPGGDLLSWSQTVTPTVPVPLPKNSALLGVRRTAVPVHADRDADGSVTTTVVPDASNVYFTGEPVAAKQSVFPFLWARKGFGHGVPALAPPMSYTAAVSSVRWPFLQAGVPRKGEGGGRLSLAAGGVSRAVVGYGGLGSLSRLANVTTVSGVLTAVGGDVVGGDRQTTTFAKTNVVHLRLPKGTFAPDAGIWGFSLALDPYDSVPFLMYDVTPQGDHDDLSIVLDLSGRIPAARTEVIDGERVQREGIPFFIVLVDNVFDGSPVVAPSLGPGFAVVRKPDGSTLRGMLAGDGRPVSLARPVLPAEGFACGFGFGADGRGRAPGAVVAPGRTGAPALSSWTIGGRVRRTPARLTAAGLDVDGVTTPLTKLRPEIDVSRHRSAWGDDIADATRLVGTTFYGAFTDECDWSSDNVHRATTVHESPGMKAGVEHRLLYVTPTVVADVRLATVSSSRSSYSRDGSVLRVVARVWSLDGQPHRVRVRALIEAHNALVQVADTTSGDGPSGPTVDRESTISGEQEVFLTPRDGKEHYRLVSGDSMAGVQGYSDAAGRYAGPQGVVTAVNRGPGLLSDPVPDGSAQLGPDVDLYLASAPSAGSPVPSSYTGFLAALLADDEDATG